MTSRDFAYWLQGFFELNGPERRALTADQCEIIKNHLNLVFVHELDDVDPTGVKQATHDGKQLLTDDHQLPSLKDLECKAEKALKSAAVAKKGPTFYRC